jgi:sarcosine oxidase subunit beta
MTTLPTAADVVIIGGGVMGVSTAFHLTEAGQRNIVLLEQGQLGCGSTSQSAGGVRLQFSDETNIELALRSMAAHEQFHVRPGGDISLQQVGYLFLLDRPDDAEAFEAGVRMQRRLGVPVEMVTAERAAALSPWCGVEGVLAATFCPRDGHCDPSSVVAGYAAAARGLGAQLTTGVTVTEVEVTNGVVSAVHTTNGSIRTPVVVCAAGAWSSAIGQSAGVDLPVAPVMRPIWFTEPAPHRPAAMPMTIDFSTGFYFHGEGSGVLFGMADPQQRAGFDVPIRADWLEHVGAVAARRAPMLTDVGIAGGWVGAYETTPDHNAIIGEAPNVGGFFACTGFSGHGFQLGPAVGEVMRDLVLRRRPSVDVEGFAVDRFERSTPRPERNIV